MEGILGPIPATADHWWSMKNGASRLMVTTRRARPITCLARWNRWNWWNWRFEGEFHGISWRNSWLVELKCWISTWHLELAVPLKNRSCQVGATGRTLNSWPLLGRTWAPVKMARFLSSRMWLNDVENVVTSEVNEPQRENWLVIGPPLRKIWVRQLGWLFPIYGKIKNVPNQPENRCQIWWRWSCVCQREHVVARTWCNVGTCGMPSDHRTWEILEMEVSMGKASRYLVNSPLLSGWWLGHPSEK